MPDEYAVYKDGRRIGTARKADPVGDAVGGTAGCLVWLALLAGIFLVLPLAISLLIPFVTTVPRMLRKREHWTAVLIALLNFALLVPPIEIAWIAWHGGDDSLLTAFGAVCLGLIAWGAIRHKWLKQTGKGITLLASAYGRGVANFWRWLFDKIFGGEDSTAASSPESNAIDRVDTRLIRDLMRAHSAAKGNKLAQDALIEKVAAEFRRANVSPEDASRVMLEVMSGSPNE